MSNKFLKKCPFCGSRPELGSDEKDGTTVHFVICSDDGCYASTGNYLEVINAIKGWNCRE